MLLRQEAQDPQGARLKPYDRTGWAALQGASRTQWRPLFGTQCRPVGGPAGFEPHLHRTALCTYTCCRACQETFASEPRPKAQVSLLQCMHEAAVKHGILLISSNSLQCKTKLCFNFMEPMWYSRSWPWSQSGRAKSNLA